MQLEEEKKQIFAEAIPFNSYTNLYTYLYISFFLLFSTLS